MNKTFHERITQCFQSVKLHLFLPGHVCLLQILLLLFRPVQSLPPCFGFGFVQLRERTWKPVPQVWEHEVHPLHFDQPPCTKLQEEEMINLYVIILYVREAQGKTQPKNYKSYGEEKKLCEGDSFLYLSLFSFESQNDHRVWSSKHSGNRPS